MRGKIIQMKPSLKELKAVITMKSFQIQGGADARSKEEVADSLSKV